MLPMLPPMPELTGPPTPAMLQKMHMLRYCVMGILVSAVGRLCTVSTDIPLGDFLAAVNGIFLLREDPAFETCYHCLMNTIIGQCAARGGGGLSCVMPFLFVCFLNCVFMVFRLFSSGPFFLTSFLFQASGAWVAWQLYSLISAGAMGELTGGQAQPLTQPFAAMRRGYPQPGGGIPLTGLGGSNNPAARGPAQPQSFQAFQGQGQRLGDP
eukprot:gnl/TRDRNA2_/TRDRNA2_40125_c0_seq1.p1 gnl/TRDRNA2_/TRDRNA2_40125_c0~~gnl/TRDRNA2_/TRDRNA2_40125_c0_seq1.p1  ORF type:complete len:211 (-),score=24.40 gnl/TRDRNA2_/TRDRNA2_40125_c0_seq1:120-752(-)